MIRFERPDVTVRLTKGARVYVEGELTYRYWTPPDADKPVKITEVRAFDVRTLNEHPPIGAMVPDPSA